MRGNIFWGCLLFGLGWSAWATERVRVQIHPLDIKENKDNHYLTSISQIESDGERLYLRSTSETEILVIEADGRLVQVIGGEGEHPSEFGYLGILAMAVNQTGLWAFDNDRLRMRYFEKGTYKNYFSMPGFNIWFSHPTSNVFAFQKDVLVLPAEPASGYLARVLRSDGTLIRWLGEPLPDLQKGSWLLGLNDTLWIATGDRWICVHKFYPLITIYDAHFNLVQQFEVTSVPIARAHAEIERFRPTTEMNAPMSVITDVKWFDDSLFLMAGGHLHQIDLRSEKTVAVAQFYGKGDDFKAVKSPFLTMYFFTFLADGRAVVAHPGLLWNHDLWLVDLPFVNRTSGHP